MKSLFVTVLVLLAAAGASAFSGPVTCASTLTMESHILPADLDCSKATAPITVKDGAVLNLGNHVFAGQIVLDGSEARLTDGTINCSYQPDFEAQDPCGVVVQGTGKHTVENVLILNPAADPGIEVISDGNFLIGNTVFASGELGAIHVRGNSNTVQRNRAVLNKNNLGGGFFILGNGNQLTANYTRLKSVGYLTAGDNNVLMNNVHAGIPDEFSATDEGFGIAGSGNRLAGNIVTDEDFGIFVFTQTNTVENNIAMRNGIDLLDGNPNCDSNIWQRNIFDTSNQACIGGTAVLVASTKAAVEKLAALLHLAQSRPAAASRVGRSRSADPPPLGSPLNQ